MPSRPTIAVTCGEPAGIGPEIAIRAAWALRAEVNCVLIGDAAFLAMTAAAIDADISLVAVSIEAVRSDGLPTFGSERLVVVDCPLHAHVVAGTLDVHNAPYVLECLDIAIESALQRWSEAIVTGPLQKSIINDAGVAFTGHTEYLAAKTGTPLVVMMLAAGVADAEAGATDPAAGTTNLAADATEAATTTTAAATDAALTSTMPPLRVALATTHLPLKDVAAALSVQHLSHVLEILHYDLQRKFGIAQPRILVTGLNPHAGENGYLGREEIDIIAPVIASHRAQGVDVRGPYPADTLFQPKYLREADCVLAMYHDQGLPVLKFSSFGRGVNITLGLPIIRTSVDHGTALELAAAGIGQADCGSMREAIRMAAQMARASLHTVATPPI